MPTAVEQQITNRFLQCARALIGGDRKYKKRKAFTDAYGILPATFDKMARGEVRVQLENIHAICKKDHVSVKFLIMGEGDMFSRKTVIDKAHELEDRMKRLEKLLLKKLG